MQEQKQKTPPKLTGYGENLRDAQKLIEFVTITVKPHGGGADRQPVNRPLNGLIYGQILCWILSWTKFEKNKKWDGGFDTSAGHLSTAIGKSKATIERALSRMRSVGLLQPHRLDGGHKTATIEYRYVDQSIVEFFQAIRRIRLAEKKPVLRQRLIEKAAQAYDLHFQGGRDFAPGYDRGPTHFRKSIVNDDKLSIAIFNEQNQQLAKNVDRHLENEIFSKTSKTEVAIFSYTNQLLTDKRKKISPLILRHNDNIVSHTPLSVFVSANQVSADAAPPKAGLRPQDGGAVQVGPVAALDLVVGQGGAKAPLSPSFNQSIVGSNSGFGSDCVAGGGERLAPSRGVRGEAPLARGRAKPPLSSICNQSQSAQSVVGDGELISIKTKTAQDQFSSDVAGFVLGDGKKSIVERSGRSDDGCEVVTVGMSLSVSERRAQLVRLGQPKSKPVRSSQSPIASASINYFHLFIEKLITGSDFKMMLGYQHRKNDGQRGGVKSFTYLFSELKSDFHIKNISDGIKSCYEERKEAVFNLLGQHNVVFLDDSSKQLVDFLQHHHVNFLAIETSPDNYQINIFLDSIIDEYVSIQRRLVSGFGCDPGANGIGRYRRMAGSLNNKIGKNGKPINFVSRLVENPDAAPISYSIDDLISLSCKFQPSEKQNSQPKTKTKNVSKTKSINNNRLKSSTLDSLSGLDSHSDFKATCIMLSTGKQEQYISDWLVKSATAKGRKNKKKDPIYYADLTIGKARVRLSA